MAGRAENDLLAGLGRVGMLSVVGGHQSRHIHEIGLGRLLSRPVMRLHRLLLRQVKSPARCRADVRP
jgi:hypothetical protein